MKLVLAAFLLCLATSASAEDISATVLDVHDGDTIKVRLAGDCLPDLFRVMLVRLNGCDTPELRDTRSEVAERARMAQEFTRGLLRPGMSVVVRGASWDKYGGRIVGRIEVDGVDLCALLIDAGLAREYHGRGAKPW